MFLCGATLTATSFVMMSDADLADQSDHIAVVEIESLRGPLQGEAARTRYQARVLRWLKNPLARSRVTVSVPGGRYPDGSGLRIAAAPRFARGSRAILFLKQRGDGTLGVNQLLLGAFHQVRYRGRTLALRILEEARLFNLRGGQFDNRRARDFQRFAEWLREPSAARHRADYFTDVDSRQVPRPRYVLSTSNGSPIRWFDFDGGGNVQWRAHEDGLSEVSGGAFSEFEEALDAWSSVTGSTVDLRYGGTTTSTNEFNGRDDVNAILFDDPHDSIDGSFDCGSGGVLAIGGPYFTASTQDFQGESYHRVLEGEVVTQDGAGCFFAGNSGQNGAEVFAHEVGHALGLGHSNVSGAIMRSSAYGDGRGASLGNDDQEAMQVVYSNGEDPPPPPPPPPPAEDQADLRVLIDDSADPVPSGSSFSYSVDVTNEGPDTAENVELVVELSFKLDFVSASSGTGSCSEGAGRVECSLGNFSSGQSESVEVTVNVDPGATGTMRTDAQAGSSTHDPDESNNTRSEVTSISVSGADVGVTLQDSPDPALPGQDIVYSVTVFNHGPQSADNVDLAIVLPAQVDLVGVSPAGCSQDGWTLNCPLGSMSAGSEQAFAVTVQPPQDFQGVLQARAQADADQNDPNTANNSRSASTKVEARADLQIVKRDLADPAAAGLPLTYTLEVRNLGPSAAEDVVAFDHLPDEVDFLEAPDCSLAGRQVRCPLGRLEQGQSRLIEVVVEPAEEGAVENKASVTSETADPNVLNNSDEETTLVRSDSDFDGIPDVAENEGPNQGDGNNDGIPDRQQPGVATLRSVMGDLLTLEAPPGVMLSEVEGRHPPSLHTDLQALNLPSGLLGFRAHGLTPGQSLSLTLWMHTSTAQANSYFQHGPTADDPTPHWYEFLFDGDTGAEILDGRIVLHFRDGGRGDSDLSANGVIVDPGGPAVDPRTDADFAIVLAPRTLSGASDFFFNDFVGLALRSLQPQGGEILLDGLSQSGEPVVPTRSEHLGDTRQLTLTASQIFDDPEIASIKARGRDSAIQGFFMVGDLNLSRLDGIGAALDESRDLLFPLALESADSETVLHLFNTAGESSSVDITLFADSTTTLQPSFSVSQPSAVAEINRPLPAQGTIQVSLNELFPGQITGNGWLSVRSDQPLKGFQFRADQNSFLSAAGRRPQRTSRLLAPHFFVDGSGGGSRLHLINPGIVSISVTVKARDDESQLLGEAQLELSSNQRLSADLAELLGLQPAAGETITGFLEIDLAQQGAASPPLALGAIEFGGNRFRSLLPLIAQGRRESLFLHLAQALELNIFTGLALLNDEDAPAQVTVRAFAANGEQTAEQAFVLAPGQRRVDLLNTPTFFGAGFEQVGGYMEITSDTPVIAFALFGDNNLRYLSAIESQPLLEEE
ncbi:MAG TPA: choice-of-anchor U domain-containing protein [Acidobacteriota bacterium]|nr:choice-of-anchor U domain-containing protein [Acidobacteriota bacterium]